MNSHRPVRWLAVVVVVVAAWLLTACTWGAAPEQPPGELRIGLLATLSGSAADIVGRSTVEGAQLAAKRVNDSGGVNIGGRKIRVALVVEDDQDRAEAAIDAARKLITQQGVAAIVGPQFSRNAIPVAGVAESSRVPMISPASTRPETTAGKRYVFRAAFTDPSRGVSSHGSPVMNCTPRQSRSSMTWPAPTTRGSQTFSGTSSSRQVAR